MAPAPEGLAHAPDALRLAFKNQLHHRIAVTVPTDELLVLSRGGLQQQRRPNGRRQTGLAQIVRSVEDVKPGAEFKLSFPDAAKVLNQQRNELHCLASRTMR